MKRCVLLIVFISVFIGGCATTTMKRDYATGEIFRDVINWEDKKVPLPEGEWKVAGTGTKDMGKYSEIFLQKVTKENKFSGLVIIVSDTTLNNYTGYTQNKFAERKDHHHAVVKSNTRTSTSNEGLDVWIISHYVHSFSPGEREASKEYLKYLTDNKIDLQQLSIRSYHQITGKIMKKRYLLVEYYFNPATAGFDTNGETNWGSSSWHVARIASDPKKVAYIDKIKKQGEILHSKLKAWFDD